MVFELKLHCFRNSSTVLKNSMLDNICYAVGKILELIWYCAACVPVGAASCSACYLARRSTKGSGFFVGLVNTTKKIFKVFVEMGGANCHLWGWWVMD